MNTVLMRCRKIVLALFLSSVTSSLAWAAEQVGVTDKRAHSTVPKRIHKTELIREKLSFSFGSFYSGGEFGTDQTTDSYSFPFRVSYARGDWRVSAKIPYLYIDGPASVEAISDGIEIIEKIALGERQRWGNGDLRLSAQRQVFRSSNRSYATHAGASVKIPIASERDGLGSGEFDYSFFTGGYLRTGNWVTNGRIGYQFMGDTDETDYNNRFYASLGGYYRFGRLKSAGFTLYQKQAVVETSDPIRTLSTYFNLRMKDGWRTSFSLGKGFTDSSSDFFAGVQFTKSFVRKRRVSSDY